MPNVTLKQLEYFAAVARHRTMREAARRLHLTESALSSSLDQLEQALGQQLCIRRRSVGVSLTGAGRLLLEHADAVLAAAADLHQAMSDPGTGPAGVVRVGMSSSLVSILAVPLLELMDITAPEIEVQVHPGPRDELLPLLDRGEIDLAIVLSIGATLRTHQAPLFSCEVRVVVAPPPGPPPESVRLDALLDEPLILLDSPLGREFARHAFAPLGSEPRIGRRVPTPELALALVAAKRGYGIVAADLVAATAERWGLLLLPAEPELPHADAVLTWAAGLSLSPPARATRDTLTAAGPFLLSR